MPIEPILKETDPEMENTGWKMQKKNQTGFRRILISGVLSLIIVAAGILGAKYLITTRPKTAKLPAAQKAPMVLVQSVSPETHRVNISAMGTVIPARKIVLKARVSGEIIKVHPDFVEGGFLSKGSLALQIDDTDYKLAHIKKESSVGNAQYALELERGRQTVARREWDLLHGQIPETNTNADLALRKPHLDKARSDLAAAKADLAQARLDLERTRVYVPFNAIIQNRYVENGSQVTAWERLADLVDTDEYWIQVSVPVDHLRWITIPRNPPRRGAHAAIHYHASAPRSGMITSLLSDLEPEGRMARLVVSVKDPLGLRGATESISPLLIGEYVRVEISGQRLTGVYRIPRIALRDDNRIWIAGEKDILEIRKVDPIWRDTQSVILSAGLSPGERLILSDIPVPVTGMPITIQIPTTPVPSSPGKGSE